MKKKKRALKIEKVCLTFTGGIPKEYGKHPFGRSPDFNNTCSKQSPKEKSHFVFNISFTAGINQQCFVGAGEDNSELYLF